MSGSRRELVFSGMDDDDDEFHESASTVALKQSDKPAKLKKRRSFISFASRAVQIPSRPILPRSSSMALIPTKSEGQKPDIHGFGSVIPRSDSADQLFRKEQGLGRVRMAADTVLVNHDSEKAALKRQSERDDVLASALTESAVSTTSLVSSTEDPSPRAIGGVAAELIAAYMEPGDEETVAELTKQKQISDEASNDERKHKDGKGAETMESVEREETETAKPNAGKEEKEPAVSTGTEEKQRTEVPLPEVEAEDALRSAMDNVVLRPKRRSKQMAGIGAQSSSPALRTTFETVIPKPLASSTTALSLRGEEEEVDEEKLVGDYLLGGVLGEGTFGKVYKALHRLTGEFVAIKEIATHGDEDDMASVMSEVQLLKRLDHPNIVQFKDIMQRDSKYYIALEFIENGSLKDVLKKFGRFPESLALVYIIQLLQGLSYLHDADIIHRDIKGANILITKNGTCKLADFGLAAEIRDKAASHDPAGSVYWMAPELFEVDDECVVGTSKASDIWSLGCTVIELLTGSPPYSGMGRMAAIHAIVEDDQPPLPNCSSGLLSFLRCCLQKDVKKRKTANQLLGHPWIVGQTPQKSGDYHMLTKTLRDFRKTSQGPSSHSARQARQSVCNSTKSNSIIASLATFEVKKDQLRQFSQQLTAAGIELPPELMATLTEHQEDMAKLYNLAIDLHSDVLAAYTDIEELGVKLGESAENATCALQTTEDYRTKLRLLEQNFKQSDDVLARLVYGGRLAMANFMDVKKGVLKVKKPHEKWKKRHIVLKDNFVFIYKPEDNSSPLDVVWLNRVSIQPQDAKVVGESFAFKLCTSKKWLYICAAKDSIMVSWMKALSFPTPWYDAEDFGSLMSPRSPRAEVTSRSRSLSSPKAIRDALPDRIEELGPSRAPAKSPTMSPRSSSRPRSIFGMKRSTSKVS